MGVAEYVAACSATGSCVGLWMLDGDLTADVGGLDASWVTAGSFTSPGPDGSSSYATFTRASSQYASTGTSATWPDGQPFTLLAWARPTSSVDKLRILGRGGTTNGYGFGVQTTNQRAAFTTYGIQDYNSANAASQAPLNTWTHIAHTFDASFDVGVYINGSFIETLTGGSNPGGPGDVGWAIGTARLTSPTEYWDGGLWGVGVFNTVLSAGSIDAIFDATTASSSAGGGGEVARPGRHRGRLPAREPKWF